MVSTSNLVSSSSPSNAVLLEGIFLGFARDCVPDFRVDTRAFVGRFKLALVGGFLVEERGLVGHLPLIAGFGGGSFASGEVTVAVGFLEPSFFF